MAQLMSSIESELANPNLWENQALPFCTGIVSIWPNNLPSLTKNVTINKVIITQYVLIFQLIELRNQNLSDF